MGNINVLIVEGNNPKDSEVFIKAAKASCAENLKNIVLKLEPISNVTIINPAIGAKINCPKDEPAFIKPKAIPTFSCGISLFTEASTTGRPAIPSPIDAITPNDIDKVNAVVE